MARREEFSIAREVKITSVALGVVLISGIASTEHLLWLIPNFPQMEATLPFGLYPRGTIIFMAVVEATLPILLILSSFLVCLTSGSSLKFPNRRFVALKILVAVTLSFVNLIVLQTGLQLSTTSLNTLGSSDARILSNLHGLSGLVVSLSYLWGWPHLNNCSDKAK